MTESHNDAFLRMYSHCEAMHDCTSKQNPTSCISFISFLVALVVYLVCDHILFYLFKRHDIQLHDTKIFIKKKEARKDEEEEKVCNIFTLWYCSHHECVQTFCIVVYV